MECICLFTNMYLSFVYGEKEQLERLIENYTGSTLNFTTCFKAGLNWGPYIQFDSIASARTILLRSNFKYSYQTQVNATQYIECWIKE